MVHDSANLELSVVAPAHNEHDNIDGLITEISAALDPLSIGYEIVIVDDASTDDTLEILTKLQIENPHLRVLHLPAPSIGVGNGQSCAFKAGFAATRGAIICVLDADLQNDPSDIPRMLEEMKNHDADFVQGDRSRNRKDGWFKGFSSVIGRVSRRVLLGDTIRDTGCSLRLMKREIALMIPLEFKGMHRFIPITARQMGYKVIEMPVAHRARVAGETKYGKLSRAIPGLVDCFAVRWMRKRRVIARPEEIVAEKETTR